MSSGAITSIGLEFRKKILLLCYEYFNCNIMESENLIPVVCWTKKNFASEFPISNLKNMPMEIEDPETNEEAVPVFASHEVDEEDQFPLELDDSEEE